MFSSVLIANRGEIACRIARTAKRLGMRTIAIYSAADANAPHRWLCDESYFIGPAQARESYLSIERLIEIAKKSRAECIHPGYGFLSENADFADACGEVGIVFVGPPARAMREMGLKDRAKALMERAGVPIVRGYHGDRQEAKFLKQKADEIGYPLLIKAAAGGGGRGMRRVDQPGEFDDALAGAIRETAAAFGSTRVLIEKYIATPRHVEFQIFADGQGNTIHLGERDCTLQRRHQKVIEEAPAPGMTQSLRAQIGAAAVAAAKAVGYIGAGTVEFVADSSEGLRADRFWFIEMNTRLQVEHPVTEAVTGLDLVAWQFQVAAGEKLPLAQQDVRLAGHAVEARVYAEDPENGFLPSTGRIVALEFPREARVDTGVEAGGEVTPFYDPMLAKIITQAPTREAALEALADALERTSIAGVRSNVAFLGALCRAREFRQASIDTGFIDRNLAALGAVRRKPDWAAAVLGVVHLLAHQAAGAQAVAAQSHSEIYSPWAARDGFQLTGIRTVTVPVVVEGERAEAIVTYGRRGMQVVIGGIAAAPDGKVFAVDAEAYVLRQGRQTRVRLQDLSLRAAETGAGHGLIKAPMHGKVLEVFVRAGDVVSGGQRLAVIEAMKMEHTLRAPFAGVVTAVAAAVGQQVVEGEDMVVIGRAKED